MLLKRRGTLYALVLAALLVLSLLPVNALAADGDVKLTIIHTNDRHGRTQSDPYISQMKKDLVNNGENVLILDAGDSTHGQTATNLTRGQAMVEIMNTVGYDAMAPGNHDFNFGVDRLMELSEMMDFKLLAANVKGSGGQNLFESYTVFDMKGVKVGVFGLATTETVNKADPRIMVGITFDDPAETAAAMVKQLKGEGCDVIIALAHLGEDRSSAPANRSDAVAAVSGIDVIIDGHSHTQLDNGRMSGETLIAQTGYYAGHIGIVEITKNGGNITKTARLEATPAEGVESALIPDEAVVANIAREDEKLEPITGQIVGYTPVLLRGERAEVRAGETNLSDLITDSMIYATGAEIAFLGGGNIRASIDAGDITMGEVLTTLPFANLLVTAQLTGSDLLEVLEHGVSEYPDLAGMYIQLSGLRFEFDPAAPPMHRVTKVTMPDGSPFDEDKTYTVATSEFILSGGDGYSMMERAVNETFYQGDAEALAAYLATNPAISAEPDNRVAAVTSRAAAEPAQDSREIPYPQPVPVVEEAPPPVYEPNGAAGIYIVKPGDNLSKIAETYGVTWRQLQSLNNLKNPDLIYPDQEILVPGA